MEHVDKSYEDAVYKLVVELVSPPMSTKAKRIDQTKKVDMMKTFLERLGLSDFHPGMDFIHISGTKGKGSTCAFSESILHCHGYRTGMFTSPHMHEARERIRINGRPITKEKFAIYFWEVYTGLKQTATKESLNEVGGMPAMFNFTVLLAYYVFIKEKVNVAIFEVGIGGEYDSTNFLARPTVCGVTSLGYDHLSVLGETLGQIAWHKAGIFKKGCPAITVPQQNTPPRPKFKRLDVSLRPASSAGLVSRISGLLGGLATVLWWPFSSLLTWVSHWWRYRIVGSHPMKVILDRAIERQCPVFVAPALQGVELGISGLKQPGNAALAVQICKIVRQTQEERASLSVATKGWRVSDIPQLVTTPQDLDKATLEGLKSCYWPGRTEKLRHNDVTYYLDGAHNEESIEHCASWFKQEADKEKAEIEKADGSVVRLLVFNLTKNRNPGNLLRHLTTCGFDEAVFTPHLLSTVPSGTFMDHFDKHLSADTRVQVPMENCATWDLLTNSPRPSHAFPCVMQALAWVTQGRDPLIRVRDPGAVLPKIPPRYIKATHIQVLVTGSLLLVGPVLGILKPGMND